MDRRKYHFIIVHSNIGFQTVYRYISLLLFGSVAMRVSNNKIYSSNLVGSRSVARAYYYLYIILRKYFHNLKLTFSTIQTIIIGILKSIHRNLKYSFI